MYWLINGQVLRYISPEKLDIQNYIHATHTARWCPLIKYMESSCNFCKLASLANFPPD